MEEFIYLYHGSDCKVPKPSAEHNKGHFYELDFGSGFYTTPDPEVAEMWALAKSKGQGGVVTRYKFYIQDAMQHCSCIDFGAQNDGYMSWMETITKCRMYYEEITGHQILIGPISDDNGYSLLMGYVDTNKISQYDFVTDYLEAIEQPDVAVIALLDESPGEQIVFKDETSLQFLEYDGVE